MPPIVGMRGTDNLAPEQKYIEMADRIKMLVPDQTPFTTFLQSLSSVKTGWPEYKALEDDVLPRFDAVAGAGGTAVTFNVSTGTKFNKNDVIIATRTGEQMIVSSVAGNAVTVVRGTTPVALIDLDEILIAGSAQPEGDLSRIPVSVNPTPVQNYTQILRRSWELTGTNYASENETDPHDWDYQAAKIGIEHKRDIERTLLFNGAPSKATASNGQPLRTTGGFVWSIKTNQMDAGGGFSEDELNAFSRQVFRYGSKREEVRDQRDHVRLAVRRAGPGHQLGDGGHQVRRDADRVRRGQRPLPLPPEQQGQPQQPRQHEHSAAGRGLAPGRVADRVRARGQPREDRRDRDGHHRRGLI
jgi:hypothetical protein